MSLFTKSISSQRIETVLRNKLGFKNIKVTKFNEIHDMDWIIGTYDNVNIKISHHLHSDRLSFTGSLIDVGLETGVPTKIFETYIPTLEKIKENLLKHFGGVIIQGDEIVQSEDGDNMEDINFLVERLIDTGINTEKFSELLENELNKLESSKKGN